MKITAILSLLSVIFVLVSSVQVEKEWYSFNGWYNHPTKPDWGTVDWRMGSRMFPQYGDGGYSPSGVTRPSPRDISEKIFANPQANNPAPSAVGRTVLNAFMAQHLWHEILDMDRPHCAPEPDHILIAANDTAFDPTGRGDRFIPFWRARYDIVTGQNPNVPRMFINGETSWFDASSIYGGSKSFSDLLRSHEGGKLASSDADGKFPKLNTQGLPMKNPPGPRDHALNTPSRLFIFGNKRANENPAILALQILWFREHNFQAQRIATENPGLDDFSIFFLARQFVTAELQHILLDEWIPNWLGAPLATYTGWKTSSPPGINTEFSIAFRYGESLIPPGLFRRDNNCVYKDFTPPQDGTPRPAARLCNLYWNSQDIFADGSDIDEVLLGMSSQLAEAEDQFFVDDLRLFSYGNLEFSRRDLMALHIQRGRDFGLGDYNLARVNYGLLPLQDFANLTNNQVVNQVVADLYQNNFTNLDIFVGGMLESQGKPGALFDAIYRDTFERIRDGDRLWYENTLTGLFNDSEIAAIKAITFKDIILRNTKINVNAIQNNPFIFVTGTDFCPQPFQLAPQNLESCVPLKDFDYFSVSYSHIPIVVILLVFYCICLALIVFLMVIRRRGIEETVIINVAHSVTDAVGKDGVMGYAAVLETEEDGITKKQTVFLMCRRTRLLVEDQKHKFLREVAMANIESVMLGGKGGSAKMLIRVPKEYDLFLDFADSMRRHNFYLDLSRNKNQQLLAENASVRHMKSVMKTKTMRKKEMKKFFKHAIKGVVSRGEYKEEKFPKEIYEEQLSADEFAESFSIPKNSLFVQQLYGMVDKDQKGFVTFREFLDFMGIFYNGTSEEKLSFLFDLYDTERQGAISKENLAKMLKSNLEIANAQHMEDNSINKIVDMIFAELGLNNSQKIKFNDFKEFIGRSGANMAITVKDEYQVKSKDKKPTFAPTSSQKSQMQSPDQYSTIQINENMRSALQGKSDKSQQYYTVLFSSQQVQESFIQQKQDAANPLKMFASAYGDGKIEENIKSIDVTPGEDLNSFQKMMAYYRDNRSAVFILAIYALAGGLIFADRAWAITALKEHSGFRRYIGEIVTVTAKGAANNMNFNYSLLLLTMCRNLFTLLRSGKVFGVALYKYIPFDGIYTFHKLVATVAIFWALVHTCAHFINFFHLTTQPPDVLLCLIREYFWFSDELPSFAWYLFLTIPGFTGVLLLLVLFALHAFSFQYSRKNVYGAFWTTHHVCAVLVYILTVLHGASRILAPPAFYIFMIPPAFIFLVDRLITVTRQSMEVPVVEVELLPSGVTKIVYKRPDDFEYKAGQWIRLSCAAISPWEYHAFTMTSAPHERHLSNHIRAVGPWTNAIREVYNPSQIRLGSLPHIRIDGPYGEGHQEWNAFEVVIMCGGGIGVTPFAAILKDIVHQSASNTNIFMKKAYFFWVCRNQKQFEWLVDIIRECENKDIRNLLEVHIFITELQHKYDLRTTMLHVCERTFQKISKRSLFTGCKAQTHFGRPNFSHLFSQLQQTHFTARKIGVFSCGPPALTYSVDDGAKAVNTLTGPRFHHHFENF